MFCNQCGKEIPNGAEFCNFCGAKQNLQQPVQPAQQFENPQPVQQFETPQPVQYGQQQFQQPIQPNIPVKPEKKLSTGAIIGIVIGALVLIGIIIGVATASSDSDNNNEYNNGYSDDSVFDDVTDAPNPEYEALLDKYNVIEIDNPFFGMDCESFAKEYSGVGLEVSKYGYDGDTVKEMKLYTYYDVSKYNDEQKVQIQENIKTELENKFGSLDFVTIDYDSGADVFAVTVSVTDVDDYGNIQKLYEAGVFASFENGIYISMEKSIDAFISNGYIQK